VIAKLLVNFYRLVHGKLHLPGAGWLIRRLLPYVPGLYAYPLKVPDVGTALLDFRDEAAFGLLNFQLNDLGNDAPLVHHMEAVLEREQVLWDIGANVGYVCMYFARPCHQLSAIHAFEPNPVALKSLRSLFRSHLRVTVHPVGLGARDDQLEMHIPPNGSQLGSVVRKMDRGERVLIQVRAGDAYRKEQQIPLPDIVKIDVEGFEPSVFSGLPETIAQTRPIIFFEHLWLNDDQIRKLVPPDYTLLFILQDGTLTADFVRRTKGHDAVLVPTEKTHRLGS